MGPKIHQSFMNQFLWCVCAGSLATQSLSLSRDHQKVLRKKNLNVSKYFPSLQITKTMFEGLALGSFQPVTNLIKIHSPVANQIQTLINETVAHLLKLITNLSQNNISQEPNFSCDQYKLIWQFSPVMVSLRSLH